MLAERLVGRGATEPPPGPLSFTPRSKKALELAVREAKEDRSVHVRSEHLLLGIAPVREGLAARVLRDLGADYDDLESRLRRAALACSFCGRSGVDLAHLVAGPGVFICDRCIDRGLQAATQGSDVVESRPQFRTVPRSRRSARCSFCRKGVADVERLVASGAAAICDDCLRLARETQWEGRRTLNEAND
jgi:ClpX C4-type zinc finger protein/ClpA/ClpB-like protein